MFQLADYQIDAVNRMHNGCILFGGVGSGKSRTAIAYYYKANGGPIDSEEYIPMNDPPMDLYIITTAKKRDSMEWEDEFPQFLLSIDPDVSLYRHKIIIDSWNNIKHYLDVKNAFFIFDEQRVVGYGEWTKAFFNIARNNQWILLTATPGDTWMDYMPVFIANGFYKNKTDFVNQHVVWKPRVKFYKVDRYVGTRKLQHNLSKILVPMNYTHDISYHHIKLESDYDFNLYKYVGRERKNPFKKYRPLRDINELCHVWRRIINTDPSKIELVLSVFNRYHKLIIFYNFDYELQILKSIDYGDDVQIAEWNGHAHQDVPDSSKWVYLVQYNAGSEAWNCIKTNVILFYSLSYSYKCMKQCIGRIDRMNTPFSDLFYYYIVTRSNIDRSIIEALRKKKNFNIKNLEMNYEKDLCSCSETLHEDS